MPSRQMGMSTGTRHAREQCTHQGCVERPGSSPETLKGQSVQITSIFMRSGYAITISVWMKQWKWKKNVFQSHFKSAFSFLNSRCGEKRDISFFWHFAGTSQLVLSKVFQQFCWVSCQKPMRDLLLAYIPWKSFYRHGSYLYFAQW